MLNWIFLGLIASAVVAGAATGTMQAVTDASIQSAKSAVELAIALIGQMALWLGVFQILEDAGLLRQIARAVRPIMSRLFEDVPADHPAMSAMLLNIAANMMGLTNAATPFGIKAMIELNRLNTKKGVATDAMALFLAINTSGVAVLPTGVIAVRSAMGAEDVTGIFFPSILANLCSTIVGIIVAKLLQRMGVFSFARAKELPHAAVDEALTGAVKGLDDAEKKAAVTSPLAPLRAAAALAVMLCVGLGFVHYIITFRLLRLDASQVSGLDIIKEVSAAWIMPLMIVTILLVGFSFRIHVYESVVKGARQGFSVAVMIIPFLVAILVAIGMFRASGSMDALVSVIGPVTEQFGLPAEALPMAIIRPLSGSGALGVLMETMNAYGPDSFVGFVVSCMSGSTETTFYVLAVYFGAVGVRAARHTVLACLAADVTGVAAATYWAHLFY